MHKVNVRAIFLNGCTVYVEAMLNLATQLFVPSWLHGCLINSLGSCKPAEEMEYCGGSCDAHREMMLLACVCCPVCTRTTWAGPINGQSESSNGSSIGRKAKDMIFIV